MPRGSRTQRTCNTCILRLRRHLQQELKLESMQQFLPHNVVKRFLHRRNPSITIIMKMKNFQSQGLLLQNINITLMTNKSLNQSQSRRKLMMINYCWIHMPRLYTMIIKMNPNTMIIKKSPWKSNSLSSKLVSCLSWLLSSPRKFRP